MDVTRIIFDCPLSPWVVGAAALAVLGAVTLVTRSDALRLNPLRRRTILVLAAVALLMLTGIVLSPKLIRTWPDPQRPRCVVLVDTSRSMLLADTYKGPLAEWLRKQNPPRTSTGPAHTQPARSRPSRPDTPRHGTGATPRWRRDDVARLVLAHTPDGWLARVRTQFDVTGCQFARRLARLALGEGASAPEVNPQGYATALGDALHHAADATHGRRPAGIVLVSDGASNTGRDPSEVARVLGRLGTPVFVVGVGDPDPPRDVAVTALRAPTSALLGDEVMLTAQVATTGLGAQRLTVELTCQGQPCARKPIVTRATGRPVNVNFSFVPTGPGHHLFAARVPELVGEQNVDNNAATAVVGVSERRIGVLLVEGEPRWEFRFLRNVLERDPAVTLTVCLVRPGLGPIAGKGHLTALPTDKKELAPYDLVILGDVGAKAGGALPDAFLSRVVDMVKHRGAALAVLAGRRAHYRRLVGSPLEPILPVVLTGASPSPAGGAAVPLELTPDGAQHLLTRLAPTPEDNTVCWSQLPGVHWSAGVGALRRGATALVVHPYRLAGASKLPVLAVARVGAGKVLWSGIEETWRWRKSVGDKHHYRFWAQAIRWLVKKRFAEGDPHARLAVDRTECSVGERVEVETLCLGPDGFALDDARVWLAVTQGDEPSVRLAMQPAPGGWGIYRAWFTPTTPGRFRMQPIVSTYGSQPRASTVWVDVRRADLEKHLLAQDRATLEAVAQASGGRYLEPNQATRLSSLLVGTVEERLLVAEYSPCRHRAYYVVMALVLAAGWLFRKRSGLA